MLTWVVPLKMSLPSLVGWCGWGLFSPPSRQRRARETPLESFLPTAQAPEFLVGHGTVYPLISSLVRTQLPWKGPPYVYWDGAGGNARISAFLARLPTQVAQHLDCCKKMKTSLGFACLWLFSGQVPQGKAEALWAAPQVNARCFLPSYMGGARWGGVQS